jgi:hypothetical protein
MDMTLAFIMGASLVALLLVAGGAFWVDQRDKARRHAERMKRIEMSLPLDDVSITRMRALGMIGVLVPACSLGAATTATWFLLSNAETLQFHPWLLACVWGVAGVVCVVALPATIARLRDGGRASTVASANGAHKGEALTRSPAG